MRPNPEARSEPVVRELRGPLIPLQHSLHGMHQRVQHLFDCQVPVRATEHELMQPGAQEPPEAGEDMGVEWLEHGCHGRRNGAWPNVLRALLPAPAPKRGKSERPLAGWLSVGCVRLEYLPDATDYVGKDFVIDLCRFSSLHFGLASSLSDSSSSGFPLTSFARSGESTLGAALVEQCRRI